MKVHLIKKLVIEDYYGKHPSSKAGFMQWLDKLNSANWSTPEDIQSTFGSADLLAKGSRRVVFDISGNNYRMICKYKFTKHMVHLSIRWIGTHPEYDKLCGYDKNKKKGSQDDEQYTINMY